MKHRILSLFTVFALCGLASTAAAQDEAAAPEPIAEPEPVAEPEAAAAEDTAAPEDTSTGKKPISAGLLLGYGLSLEDGPNLLGLGFGVAGGYTLDMGVYLGARFIYYLGEDPLNMWDLGIEGGYAIAMDKLTIRPGLGLGIANVTVDIPVVLGVGGSASNSEFYIAPGGAVLYDVSDSIFVGLDVRLQLVMADPDTVKALTFLANGGMRF